MSPAAALWGAGEPLRPKHRVLGDLGGAQLDEALSGACGQGCGEPRAREEEVPGPAVVQAGQRHSAQDGP